jgi:hypothetical protein
MRPVGDLPPIPKWFADEVTALFALYPSATISRATTVSWWRFLHQLPRRALEHAFNRAPSQSPQWAPSAELVRQIAEPTARTLAMPVPDYSRAALPERDSAADLDPAMRARYEQARAIGDEEQRRKTLSRIFAELVESL